MPKPPLPKNLYRGKRIEVLCTESEYKVLEQLAREKGMRLGAYLRYIAMYHATFLQKTEPQGIVG